MTVTQAPAINSTYEYHIFKLMKGNRQIDLNHVKQLKREMQRNPDLLASNPILVNEHLFIIDGQHRWMAATELKRKLYYIVADGATIDQTRHLNTTQRSWSLIDFAKSYADSGRKGYIDFLRFHEKFPLIQLSILQGYLANRQSHDITSSFRRGDFEVTDLALAQKNLEKLNDVITMTHMSPGKPMALCLLDLMNNNPDFDIDIFIKKLERESARELYQPQVSVRGCLRSIEAVYNFQSKVNKRLY